MTFMTETSAVIDRILDAHGGLDHWRTLTGVEVEFSAWGFLFTAKGVARLRHARLTVGTRAPEVTMRDYPAAGQQAALHGHDRVEIVDSSGAVLQGRSDPRAAFGRWRRQLRWDALDFIYFSSYAWWNYLNLPFLLRFPGVQIRTPETTRGGTRLTIEFANDLPTHCPKQTLWFDAEDRLIRHDYTAEVVGGWARATHLCSDYRQFGRLWLPTRRRVYPRGPGGRPLPAPLLVGLDVHDAQPIPAGT